MKALVFLFLLAYASSQSIPVIPTVNVWPYPQSFQNGSTTLSLNPNFFNFVGQTPWGQDILDNAFQRYKSLIFNANGLPAHVPSGGAVFYRNYNNITNPTGSVFNLTVTVTSNTEVPLGYGVDESYQLIVSSEAKLTANTVWGALRGIETFSQLVEWNGQIYYIPNTPVQISDFPRFGWRGILLDTGRHYFPVSTILRTLDAMSYHKMNVLHWHMVDGDSFAFQSTTWPTLSEAAYTPASIYTHSDITNIVNYARFRGIRVIPEFDMPGHSASWGVGLPGVTIPCWEWAQNGNPLGLFWNVITLDVTNDYTYTVIDGLIKELAALFPDEYIHLGGDEVFAQGCWGSQPYVLEWMETNGYAEYVNDTWVYNYTGLWGDFEAKVQAIGVKYGKRVVLWEESFDHGFELLNTTTINIWLSPQELESVVTSGRDAVLSYGYYLDRQMPTCNNPGVTGGCPNEDYHWFFIDTWEDFYLNEPLDGLNLTPEQEAHVLGGEGSAWGENMDTATIDDRIWTRGGAIAERLWSAREVNDTIQASVRLSAFRCKLVRRGIMSGPITVDFCAWNTPSTNTPGTEVAEASRTWKYIAYSFIIATVLLLLVN
eukprot:TRINITY_DN2571_c0_g1_i1.p1 TRINITY_DN2571_c0_g1~~TRINITY_DN2571_c0_g1_i1.p1  ORF type:complete len:599 (-),score=91.60 TRINITY_DN2571_c0_g1_i1:147-1943(-)